MSQSTHEFLPIDHPKPSTHSKCLRPQLRQQCPKRLHFAWPNHSLIPVLGDMRASDDWPILATVNHRLTRTTWNHRKEPGLIDREQ